MSNPNTHAHVMLTQLSIKEELKSHGTRGNEAILKELKQFHLREALVPRHKEEMSHDKGRGCCGTQCS